jgi:hypothetical protein
MFFHDVSILDSALIFEPASSLSLRGNGDARSNDKIPGRALCSCEMAPYLSVFYPKNSFAFGANVDDYGAVR